MKVLWSLSLTALYVAVLIFVYIAHALYFPVDVVLYSAVFDAVLATAIARVLLLFIDAPFNGFERALLVVVWLLCGYTFAISGPAVLDRSLSFYILEKLKQRGGGVKEARIGDVFVNEYMPEFRLVDVRLTEQLKSGTITIENGCVKLTPWGDRLATISHYIRTHFLAKNRLLMGQYTDDLVEPFKNSRTIEMGYECK